MRKEKEIGRRPWTKTKHSISLRFEKYVAILSGGLYDFGMVLAFKWYVSKFHDISTVSLKVIVVLVTPLFWSVGPLSSVAVYSANSKTSVTCTVMVRLSWKFPAYRLKVCPIQISYGSACCHIYVKQKRIFLLTKYLGHQKSFLLSNFRSFFYWFRPSLTLSLYKYFDINIIKETFLQ